MISIFLSLPLHKHIDPSLMQTQQKMIKIEICIDKETNINNRNRQKHKHIPEHQHRKKT